MSLRPPPRPSGFPFLSVLAASIALVLISGTTAFILAGLESLSPAQTTLFEICSNSFEKGCYGIFGLLAFNVLKK